MLYIRHRHYICVLIMALMFILLIGAASADYGYTNVSQIPMAVDFSVRVDFDDAGMPHIVTDYPFEETGATQMNLVYNKGDIQEAVTLQYQYPSGVTSIGGYDSRLYDYAHLEDAYQAIRNGELVRDDLVYVNTSGFSAETDWILVYSASAKHYVEYTEKTQAQAFNAMGSGGVAKSVYYIANEIDYTRVLVRIDDADLIMERNRTGDLTFAYVSQYRPDNVGYDYNPSTGLFGGHSLTELGFNESDLEISALAARGDRTGTENTYTSVSVVKDPTVEVAPRSTVTIVGGLLSGIMIGITLYYLFRRRKSKPDETINAGKNSSADSVNQEEPYESTVNTFHNH